VLSQKIIEKYNVPSPRYTSYPTILHWNRMEFTDGELGAHLTRSLLTSSDFRTSVYVHLPYCDSLCTFCGCHKHITKNHGVEKPYIDSVIEEWRMYNRISPQSLKVEELHLGGGTPTFFSVSELERLIKAITSNETSSRNFSFEGHPNHTSEEQLKKLFELGFRRVSFGVQDYDATVQKAINRIQDFETVKRVTVQAREIGYESVSHDLVFGLPFQTIRCMETTIDLTLELMPDTISLYSYAHVPWVKGTGQRGFSEKDIPTGKEKRDLYEYAKTRLLEVGYVEIGMDHFGLPNEKMTIAMKEKKLHRNFMGYTTSSTNRLIGLGVSAISEHDFGYAQNFKSVKDYHQKIENGEIPVFKGHVHSARDKMLKKHILSLMCNLETNYCPNSVLNDRTGNFKLALKNFEKDGIIEWNGRIIKITEDGKPFVRNVCMALDPYIINKEKNRFSQSV
jgi:oxygen-independent coproporphyrinogen-3 oxidase